ncbi:AAA family ATPase [Patescibacteria group bacterium]|nr:AAA family ATPase [Patescibacteria group bacterium]
MSSDTPKRPETGTGIDGGIRFGKDKAPRIPTESFTSRLGEALRPKDFDDAPGSEIIAAAGILPGQIRSLNPAYRALGIKVSEDVSLDEIKVLVESFGGQIAKTPYSEPDELRILAVMPDEVSAKKLAATITLRHPEALVGIQGDTTGLSAGIVKGSTVFIGDGVDSALQMPGFADDTKNLVETDAVMPKCEDDGVKNKVLESIRHIPSTLTTVCAVAEIRIPDYLNSVANERGAVLNDIFAIVDPKFDEYEWIGNTIRVVSTREGAAGALAVRLQRVLDKYKDAKIQVIIEEGNLEVVNLGEEGGHPRSLRSAAFGVRDTQIPSDGECGRGVFVGDAELARLMTPRGGVKIEEFSRHGNVIRLDKFNARTTEIYTGGPRKMIGRDKEWGDFLHTATQVYSGKQYRVMALDGEPGSGKSRFMKECMNFFGKKTDNVICAKANEDEDTKSFNYIKRLISEMLRKSKISNAAEIYRVLQAFASGEEAEDLSIQGHVQRMHQDYEMLSSTICSFVQQSPKFLACFIDDWQWCDHESAIIVAAMIRTLDLNDRVFLQLSARGDYRTMPVVIKKALEGTIPVVIRKALEEKEARTISMKSLDFESDNCKLLREYVLHSLPLEKVDQQTLPRTFLKNLAKTSGGNPFAVTQILHDLQKEGLMYVDDVGNVVVREAEINFQNYAGEALYENRLQRLSEPEKDVFKALVLFDGKVGMKLFGELFPELVPHAHALEVHGLVSTKPHLRSDHDLLEQAAKKKFRRDPKLSWSVYGKVITLIQSPEFQGQVDYEVLFGLLKPVLENPEAIDSRLHDSMYNDAIMCGLGATSSMTRQYRTKDAASMLGNMSSLIGAKRMHAGQLFQCREQQAKLALSLERDKDARTYLEDARRLAQSIGRLPSDAALDLDLRMMECEACHMARNGEALDAATERLQTLYMAISTSPPQGREAQVKALKYEIALNEAKAKLHAGDIGNAYSKCNELMTDVVTMSEGGVISLSPEFTRVVIEIKRFYANVIQVVEERERMKLDEDTVLSQSIPADKDADGRRQTLGRAVERQAQVVENYEDKSLIKNPKDMISASATLAKLAVYAGMKKVRIKGNELGPGRLIELAIQEATNYGEIGMIAYLQKIMGGMHLRHPDSHKSQMRVEKALECYKLGMQEMMQTESRENHKYYANNACDAARAVTIWVDNFGKDDPKEAKAKIQEGWKYITQAYNFYSQSPRTVAESILPTLGNLVVLGESYGVDTPLPDVPPITSDMVEMSYGIYSEKRILARNAENCVKREVDKKLTGIEKLQNLFPSSTGQPGTASKDVPEALRNLEIDGLDE